MNVIIYSNTESFRMLDINKSLNSPVVTGIPVTIAPVIDNHTLEVGDIIYLCNVNAKNRVKGYLRHFGSGGTDATFTADLTLLVLNGAGGPSIDSDGNYRVTTPYFAEDLAFDTARTDPFNIQRQSPRREVLSLRDGLKGANYDDRLQVVNNLAMVLVVKAVPTASFNIYFNLILS